MTASSTAMLIVRLDGRCSSKYECSGGVGERGKSMGSTYYRPVEAFEAFVQCLVMRNEG